MKFPENPCPVYLHRICTDFGRRQNSIRKKKAQREMLKNSIRKKKAQREVLPGGIRGDKEDRGDKGDKGG